MSAKHQVCKFCQEPFSGRPALFCSPSCKKQHRAHQYAEANRFVGSKVPTGTTGAIHEILVAADLMRRGYHVFRAMSPASPCDLAILGDGRLVRVEVTTGHRSVRGNLTHPPKKPGTHDLLAIVEKDGKITYRPEMPDRAPL